MWACEVTDEAQSSHVRGNLAFTVSIIAEQNRHRWAPSLSCKECQVKVAQAKNCSFDVCLKPVTAFYAMLCIT